MNYRARADYERLVAPVPIKNIELYWQASTHKSALNDHTDISWGSYERMEMLGDAVLNMCVTRHIFAKYPDEQEGFLTKLRTRIVGGKCLKALAEKLRLHEFIVMSPKALAQGWNTNPRVLEDAFEALVGAMFMDAGLRACDVFILDVLTRHVDMDALLDEANWKDVLMRAVQRDCAGRLPSYAVVGTSGPDHAKVFAVSALVDGVPVGHGEHACKKEAEQLAAREAIRVLGIRFDRYGNLLNAGREDCMDRGEEYRARGEEKRLVGRGEVEGYVSRAEPYVGPAYADPAYRRNVVDHSWDALPPPPPPPPGPPPPWALRG